MNTATAESIINTPVPMSWTIIAVLLMLALVLILGALDNERGSQSDWKRSQFKDDREGGPWGPLE